MARSCCAALWLGIFVIFITVAIIPVCVATKEPVKPKAINVKWNKNAQAASKTQQYQVVRVNEEDSPPLGASDQTQATSVLRTSHYYSNVSGYFEVSIEDGYLENVVVSGFTVAVFGYGSEQQSIPVADPGSSNTRTSSKTGKEGSGTGKNKAKSTNGGKDSGDRLTSIKKFNAYSGFMASPDEVIATVVGSKGGYPSNGIEVTGSASESRTYDLSNLNWTAVYATVMVALEVTEIPSTITVGSGITEALLSLVSSSGSNNVTIQVAAAYAIPNDGSAPPYTATLDLEDRKIVLDIDHDWYAGMKSVSMRSEKLAKARAQQATGTDDDSSTATDDKSTSEADGDVLAVSISVVIPNTDDQDQQEVPVNGDGTIGNAEGAIPQGAVLLYDNKLYVINNVPARHALYVGSRQYKAGGGWIALIIIMIAFIAIESVFAAIATIGWTSVVAAGYEESKLWVEANAIKEYASLMYPPQTGISGVTVSDRYDQSVFSSEAPTGLSVGMNPSLTAPLSPSLPPPPVVSYPPAQARAHPGVGKSGPVGKGKPRPNGSGDLLIGKKSVINTQPGPM